MKIIFFVIIVVILMGIIKVFFIKEKCPEGGEHEFIVTGTGWVVCKKCKKMF